VACAQYHIKNNYKAPYHWYCNATLSRKATTSQHMVTSSPGRLCLDWGCL